MRRCTILAAAGVLVLVAAGCSNSSDSDAVPIDVPATAGGAESEDELALDCEALGAVVLEQVGEPPEESFSDGMVTSVSTPLFEEQQANCSWTYPGTGARLSVSLKAVEGGATDDDRGRWAGELSETFDPDTGGQVLAPRDAAEVAEDVTVNGLGGAIYARSDGETAALYVLVTPEMGLTVATTDFAPGATTDALVAIGDETLAQVS